MTQDDILAQAEFRDGALQFKTYSAVFRRRVTHFIFVPIIDWETSEYEPDERKIATDSVVDCVNSFLGLEEEKVLGRLKESLFAVFNALIETMSYGQVPDNLILQHGNTEANRLFFDGGTRDSVYSNCIFDEVHYSPDSSLARAFSVHGKVEWEREHGVTVFFANGEVVEVC